MRTQTHLHRHSHHQKGSNVDSISNVHIIHGTMNHDKPMKNGFITALKAISTVGWLILLIAGYFLAQASPRAHFDRQFETLPSNTWDIAYLSYCFYTLCIVLFIGFIGLVTNAIGHHEHKRLFYRVNLVLLMLIALCGITFYLTR